MDGPEGDFLQAPPSVVIETDRLRLRTLRVADAEQLMPIITREDVMRWTSRPPVTTLSQAERWVSDRALGRDVFNFAIELKNHDSEDHSEHPKSNGLIGVVGSFHWPSVGYLIHPDHAGHGYATEALRALVPALFDRMPAVGESGVGFDHIEAGTDADNKASQRVLQKCGFTYCETRLQDFESPSMGLRDSAWFRIARPGKTLEELGLLPVTDQEGKLGQSDGKLVPPVE